MSEEKKNSGRIRTLPWVPESFHAPFSGCGPVFIVTRAASGFGLSPRSSAFSAGYKASHRSREKTSGTQGIRTSDLITTVIILRVKTNPLEMYTEHQTNKHNFYRVLLKLSNGERPVITS